VTRSWRAAMRAVIRPPAGVFRHSGLAAARPVAKWLDLSLASNKQYLLPHERSLAMVRRHPAILLRALIPLAAALAAASLMSAGTIPVSGTILGLAWGGCGLLAAVALAAFMKWCDSIFLITDSRLLLTHGLLIHKVDMIQLAELDNLSFSRSLSGRAIGYGVISLVPAEPQQTLRKVKYVPYPEQLYLLVTEMLFPDASQHSRQAAADRTPWQPRRPRG
jgi:Bacterial PH domain